MGLLPKSVQKGGEIAIIAGSDMPFILRRCNVDSAYRLIGDCYIHGMMSGELVEDAGQASRSFESLTLV